MKRRALLGIGLAVVGASAIMFLGVLQAGAERDLLSERVRRLTATGTVELAEVTGGTFGGIRGLGQYRDKHTGEEYVWDRTGGFIRRYSKPKAYENRRRGPRMSSERAARIAAAVARRFYEGGSIEGMRVATALVEETEEGPAQWKVDFRAFDGDIPTFNHVSVALDAASGDVMYIDQEYAEITESLDAPVARGAAIEVGAKELGVPEGCCSDASLRLVRALDGEQSMVWALAYTTGDAQFGGAGEVLVDAESGRVLDSGKSW